MKKILLIGLLAAVFWIADATAQNIVLGERTPEIKVQTWLDGKQPVTAQMTYVEFFHSSNPACKTALDRLKGLIQKTGNKMQVIVITQEDNDKATTLLRSYLSERIFVALHAGKYFTSFGVNYLPFGVLIDAKNRALWLGNTLQINEQIIKQSSF